jgi:tetratricopeptide (TPR) repeat protein
MARGRADGRWIDLGLALALCVAIGLSPGATAADDAGPLAIGLICSAEHGAPAPGHARTLVKIAGMGTGGFAIATASPEAQGWFDYGMALAHAFEHEDAKLAFQKARALDPGCAMCAWGEAWADGPTINYDTDAAARQAAGAIVDRAAALASGESPRGRALIQALKRRYTGPAPAADLAFAGAMDALVRRYPRDNEIAIVAADAWLEPYTLRDDRRGLDRAVKILAAVLRRSPNDTGAIHFYIHATEIVGAPALALPYAERLGALAPAASHLDHMPSHTFFRVGRYQDAAVANARAIGADGAYLRSQGDGSPQGRISYHGHDVAYGLAGALASGDAPLALRLADHAGFAFPAAILIQSGGQGVVGRAAIVYGRYAPDRALALPDPGAGAPYAQALRRYARGEAFAARGDAAASLGEVAAIEAAARSPASVESIRAVERIAALTLRGRAAMLRRQFGPAAQAYAAAAAIQDKDLNSKTDHDPPPWWYPERRSLAAALLAAGQPAKAAVQAREALKDWPDEPLTLEVLGEAERAAGEAAAAHRDLEAARRGWRGGSVALARI